MIIMICETAETIKKEELLTYLQDFEFKYAEIIVNDDKILIDIPKGDFE